MFNSVLSPPKTSLFIIKGYISTKNNKYICNLKLDLYLGIIFSKSGLKLGTKVV